MTDFIKNPAFKVLLKKGEFVDEARGGRIVPFKLYHPADYDGARLPVIIWSHGFGGNRDGAAFLSRFLAGQGYILLHLTHDGTDSSLWEGKDGHPWDILRKTKVSRETTINRFKDVPFVLDQLSGWAADNPEIGASMDLQNLGMSGHSFGAMTTQVMAGQRFPDANGDLIAMPEKRFRAGILYSPVPIRHLVGDDVSDDDLYGPIDIPLLHMTGTDDDSPIEGFGYRERTAVYHHSGCREKYLLVKQGGDHMVYNGTRGKLAENPLRARHEDIIKTAALAFWDAQLKGDDAAKMWLCGGGVDHYLGEWGEFAVFLAR
ncbi:MAG: alpha/beta hydrolase family protein [Bdellovibrionales bacterium]